MVSPSFPLSRLDVCSEKPKPAEEVESVPHHVEEAPAKEASMETFAPGAADGEVSAEGAPAKKASVETPTPVTAEGVASEAPVSDTEKGAEDFVLKRRTPSVRANPITAGAGAVGEAEVSEGSPGMLVLE